jgi:hypothetical protein
MSYPTMITENSDLNRKWEKSGRRNFLRALKKALGDCKSSLDMCDLLSIGMGDYDEGSMREAHKSARKISTLLDRAAVQIGVGEEDPESFLIYKLQDQANRLVLLFVRPSTDILPYAISYINTIYEICFVDKLFNRKQRETLLRKSRKASSQPKMVVMTKEALVHVPLNDNRFDNVIEENFDASHRLFLRSASGTWYTKKAGGVSFDGLSNLKTASLGKGEANKRYLESIPSSSKKAILKEIADHYGTSVSAILNEVYDAEAEALYEYMTNSPMRMVVYKGFQKRRLASEWSPVEPKFYEQLNNVVKQGSVAKTAGSRIINKIENELLPALRQDFRDYLDLEFGDGGYDGWGDDPTFEINEQMADFQRGLKYRKKNSVMGDFYQVESGGNQLYVVVDNSSWGHLEHGDIIEWDKRWWKKKPIGNLYDRDWRRKVSWEGTTYSSRRASAKTAAGRVDPEMEKALQDVFNHLTRDYALFQRSRRDDAEMKRWTDNNIREFRANLDYDVLRKYIRIHTPNGASSRSVCCFIVKEDIYEKGSLVMFKGDILRSKSWTTPRKYASYGNILRRDYTNLHWTGVGNNIYSTR